MQCDIPITVAIVGPHELADNIIEVFDAVNVNNEIILPIRVPSSLGKVIDFDGDQREWVVLSRGLCD